MRSSSIRRLRSGLIAWREKALSPPPRDPHARTPDVPAFSPLAVAGGFVCDQTRRDDSARFCGGR